VHPCWLKGLSKSVICTYAQVENCTLRDYEGNYDRFLEKNEGEAVVMAEKEAKKRELEKSQIKAKSKVSAALWYIPGILILVSASWHQICTSRGDCDVLPATSVCIPGLDYKLTAK
jgi:hypothetical protein